ncbi:MAG: peptidoglycan DD-metalloendopeptidase family protein [Bacteroidetes bacterium]|nr:peptidoglycan DD-metalloendopeptidase family protein [Bacteroidota bacterium]MBK8487424.1 peptidoglycan DD-metalloendopeptidase family protein [Bacteroidota bacterium]MBK8682832.1 peptidoglycan DD-metalloendopeptidase family protein [Bacteroidota bacterium]MBP9190335.1 peptidoglycan DD-metalloendopeptidase family protein [Chitinophagales bacterium]MBP9705394.1 peptidoglycan DD-metalloendopeptidase family protein [Chitinophagales bacterium]
MKRINFKLKFLLSMGLVYASLSSYSQAIILSDDKMAGCDMEYQLEQGYSSPTESGGSTSANRTVSVPLSWPLRMSDEYREVDGVYSYWYISNFADINHTEGSREDWMCNTGSNAKNYDQHNGVDIVPFPFGWQMMDDESVDVIAAADGEVIEWFDGNSFDRNCATPHSFVYESFNGGYYGNFIALEHSDGSVTVYAHLKIGSLANISVGDDVVSGQYLGKIGSAGNSTGPHLHFEVRPCEGCSYIEPWWDSEGCNDDVTESQWISQQPYDEPQVLRVATHDVTPSYKSCSEYESGENENVNFSNHFNSAGTIYMSVSLRDFLVGDNFTIDILNSSGTSIYNSSYTTLSNNQSITLMFSYTYVFLATGTYRVKVVHDGKTYDHYFSVNCPGSLTLSGAQSGHKAYITGDHTNATATISGVSSNIILYQAADYIQLNAGFVATSGCEYKAEIDDCAIGGMKIANTEELEIKQDAFNVFPNPSNGIFTLYYKSDITENYRVLIKNIMGETIYDSEFFMGNNELTYSVDLQNHAKGIYLIELYHGNKIETQKIVLQ